MYAVQPALSYTAPELVKGAQQSSGALFSAADVFSLGTRHWLWPTFEVLVAMLRSVVPPALFAVQLQLLTSVAGSPLLRPCGTVTTNAGSLRLNQLQACQSPCSSCDVVAHE